VPETAAAGKGLGATLGKKVGPFPLGVWAAGGVGAIWYLRKKQGSGSPAAAQSQTGYGTDPAGNTGYIDPQSGYVYGSAEDIAALQSQGQVASNSYNTGGDGSTSGVGAAGGSIGGSGAGTGAADTSGQTTGATNPSGTSITTPGVDQYGAPVVIPPPSVSPGAAAPASKNWKYPAPTGLSASNVSDSGYSLSWNPVQGPNGQKPSTYTVATYTQSGQKVDQFVSGSTSTKEYGSGGKGLKPSTSYHTQVWANGGPTAPPNASVVVTTKAKGSK
jgi:Fibronectin type III domain